MRGSVVTWSIPRYVANMPVQILFILQSELGYNPLLVLMWVLWCYLL